MDKKFLRSIPCRPDINVTSSIPSEYSFAGIFAAKAIVGAIMDKK